MQAYKWLFGNILVLLFMLLTGFAQAADEQKITLKAGGFWKKVSGEAVIKDKTPDQKEISIEMKGLKPNAVYTVWLVNTKPKMDMLGVGEKDYSFKSDGKGMGHYSATIAAAELAKWEMLEIAHHPDGNPMNMKKMDIALKAALKK